MPTTLSGARLRSSMTGDVRLRLSLPRVDQRYYASAYGRFNSPDPGRSAHPKNPLSWNRYGYALGDPVNRNDPKGLDAICGPNKVWDGEGCIDGDDGGGYPGYIQTDSSLSYLAGVLTTSDVTATIVGPGASSGAAACMAEPICGITLGSSSGYEGDSQVGQVVQQVNTLTQSVNAGFGLWATAYGGGYLSATLLPALGAYASTIAVGGTAAAGAAATGPEGQETLVDVGSTVYRVYGGVSGQLGNFWTTINPTTVLNYPGVAGLPPGNTATTLATGILNDVNGVATGVAMQIGNNLGGLPEVFVPNPACQITIICVAPFIPKQ